MSARQNSPRSPPVTRLTYSPQSPPLPYLEDPPDEEHYDQPPAGVAGDEEEIAYPEPSSEQTLLPPPNFRPFFTLIEDTKSGEHYHPYVHYVFADDDPILVTAASMRSLGLDETNFLPQQALEEGTGQQFSEDHNEAQDVPTESPLPPPIPGVKEHYLLVDVGADGRSVVDARSLSPAWQITDTRVRTAPSFDESLPDQGLMLRIEGVDISSKNKSKGKGQARQDALSEASEKSQGDIFSALDGLLQGVQRSLEVAAKISEPRRLTVEPKVEDDG